MNKVSIYLVGCVLLSACMTVNAAHPSHTSQYISQFYLTALGREPTHAELHEMMFSETEASCTTSQFEERGLSVFRSSEFRDLNLTDAAKVRLLYRAVVQRELNQATYRSYLNSLENGLELQLLASVLFSSEEFKQQAQKICSAQGLKQVIAISAPTVNTNNALLDAKYTNVESINNEEESNPTPYRPVVMLSGFSDSRSTTSGIIRVKARPRN